MQGPFTGVPLVNSQSWEKKHLLFADCTGLFNLHIYLYACFTDRAQGGSRKLSHLSEEAQPVSSQIVQLFPLYQFICPTCWGCSPDYPIFKASSLSMETLRCQLDFAFFEENVNFSSFFGSEILTHGLI